MSIAEILELEKQVIKQEYETKLKKLEEESQLGEVGDMEWLKEVTSINAPSTIRGQILYPFRKELEGRIVYYPDVKGKPWRVNKLAFKQWLDKNFERIEW